MRQREVVEKQLEQQKLDLVEQNKRYEEMEVGVVGVGEGARDVL